MNTEARNPENSLKSEALLVVNDIEHRFQNATISISIEAATRAVLLRAAGRRRVTRPAGEEASMIICHCERVSERTVRHAVRDGARSCRQVARACDAGRDCGGCRSLIREIIECESGGECVPARRTASKLAATG
jgi:bacterioferritin-associated ferredoxin